MANRAGSKHPGYYCETMPSGRIRHRVRAATRKDIRTTIPVGPDSPLFLEHYLAARDGNPVADPELVPMKSTGDLRATVHSMLMGAFRRAKDSGKEFSLTKMDVLVALKAQHGRCAVSDIAFDLSADGRKRRPFAPSIDRIDNSKGYTPENIRIVCVIINIGRADWSDADYIRACCAVVMKAASVPGFSLGRRYGTPNPVTR